jgi:hypothetical protein
MRDLSRRTFFAASALPAAAAAQEAEAGFVPLFNGKDLTGWTIVALCVSEFVTFPTWLRSAREYENFDLRGEFFVKGWTDSGVYFHAPEHGRPSQAGLQMKVFHQPETEPHSNSMGALFPFLAPRMVNVHAEWNQFRILADGASLRLWTNGGLIHDLNRDAVPDLRARLRRGYVGIVAASAACRFRNLRIRELPGHVAWTALYEEPADLARQWSVTEGQPNFTANGAVLRSDGTGYLTTREKYKDFELELYVRAMSQHNSGVLFRSEGHAGNRNPKHYEIQLHNVEEAHYPTGSLYTYQRARYPRIEDEKWYLMQLRAAGARAEVRVDGELVMEYDKLDRLEEGFIELQAHRRGYWTEFKKIRIRRL